MLTSLFHHFLSALATVYTEGVARIKIVDRLNRLKLFDTFVETGEWLAQYLKFDAERYNLISVELS